MKHFCVQVGELRKEYASASLGIDVEGVLEDDRPHHIIRSVSDSGPVGCNTKIKTGDELLEVNGETLVGMDHISQSIK